MLQSLQALLSYLHCQGALIAGNPAATESFSNQRRYTAPAKAIKDKVAFLIEAKQAGIFDIRNIPDEQIDPLLGIACPTILYPYLRSNIADVITRAGFQAIHLSEINFQALYEQRLQAAMEEAQGAEGGSSGIVMPDGSQARH